MRCIILFLTLSTSAWAQAFTCNGNLNPVNPTKGKLITCTEQHQEFMPAAPVTLTRTFGVYIPNSYVPGQSGLITKIQGTTHNIANDCNHAPAQNENAGWLVFLDAVQTAAPVMLCPQGLSDQLTSSVTDPGERWNEWGYDNSWNWHSVVGSNGNTYTGNAQIKPNDEDFILTVNQEIQTTLQTDPKWNVLENDWIEFGGLMAYELGAKHPDVFNAVVTLNDAFGIANWTGSLAIGYSDQYGFPIPAPAAPINVMILVGIDTASQGMCGGSHTVKFWGNLNDSRSLTVDDTISYWNSVNLPDTFTYEPSSASQFCNSVSHSQNAWAGLWRYVATNSVSGATVEVWNLYYDKDTPYCSFGPNGSVVPNMCASSDPPVDWRLVNIPAHIPGNPYADTTLGFSMLQIEYNFMNRSRRP